jgi:ABC-type multidrug transport system fused ATPase/permease subunit
MKLVRAVWQLVDAATRRRMGWSMLGSCSLALLDTVAVLLVFPLIQLLVAPSGAAPTATVFGMEIGGTASLDDAAILGGIVAGLFVAKSVLAILFLRWNLGFILTAEATLAGRVFTAHLEHAPAAAGALDTAGVQRTLTESLRRVFQDGLAFALPALADQLVIALLAVAALLIAPAEAVVAGVVFALAALGYRRLIHGRTSRAGAAVHREARDALALAGESLRASREIALWNAREQFVARFVAIRSRAARAQRTIALNDQLPRSYLETCLVVCTVAVAATAFALHPTAEAVALVGTFAAIGLRVLPSLNRAFLASARARTALPSLAQLEADLALATPPPADGDDTLRTTGPVERVDVRSLTVTLPGRDEPILTGVELSLRRGTITGILGASGAGKTTLVVAMLGFVPPASGHVLVNGCVPVRSAATWGGRAAYVPQEVVIFDASLRENVALGVPAREIDEDRVLGALRLAHLTDVVTSLPDGTATQLGESGSRLSGGQRQRLGIARALYHDADLLVLDEATSGLDHDSEQRILETLRELRAERTIMVVSHHRSVMERCDQLVILGHGRVVGRGAPSDVRPLLVRAGLSA